MSKARSRLKITPTQKPESGTGNSSALLSLFSFATHYKRYLPTLMIGVGCWLLLALVMTSIEPVSLQNVWAPHLYLPVVLLFFLASLFTASFLLLHTRRGTIVGLVATTFFFFRLQQFSFSTQLVSIILIFFGILELGFSLIDFGLQGSAKTKTKDANIEQKTSFTPRNSTL